MKYNLRQQQKYKVTVSSDDELISTDEDPVQSEDSALTRRRHVFHWEVSCPIGHEKSKTFLPQCKVRVTSYLNEDFDKM